MVGAIKTLNKFIQAIEGKTFNEILGCAKLNLGDMSLVNDVDDFNNNEIKCVVEYNGYPFVVELNDIDGIKFISVSIYMKQKEYSTYIVECENEIDWWAEVMALALNTSTLEFENCSGVNKLLVVEDLKRKGNTAFDKNCDFILFDSDHDRKGWAFILK